MDGCRLWGVRLTDVDPARLARAELHSTADCIEAG